MPHVYQLNRHVPMKHLSDLCTAINYVERLLQFVMTLKGNVFVYYAKDMKRFGCHTRLRRHFLWWKYFTQYDCASKTLVNPALTW